MRLLSSSLALFLSIVFAGAGASPPHNNLGLVARHHALANRATALEVQARAPTKRCPNRASKKSSSSTPKPANLTADKSTADTKKVEPPKPPPRSNTNSGGTINVKSNCGASRATPQTSKLSGPNGHIDWMNCGFETGGGWNPPYVRVQDLVTQPLSTALHNPNSPFKACSKYVWIFEKYGGQYKIPAIILAAFAMQESSCNPNTVGGAGEQGLMQITHDKCGGAPNGNCKDPEFNIRTATKFFADTLSRNNGNIFLTVGAYNGWHHGLTRWEAFAAAKSSCCRCQNNGDYLHQFFNGWIQNINAYDNNFRLGKYFNLDVCN